ncbi:MAG: glycosyltransferase [Candidatus Omnitrophota bacterium]|nr:glycosyltransferase [Candidatus Omnitrophota bacterium]
MRCYNFARALTGYGIDTEVFSFADNLGAKYGEKELEMSYLDKIRYHIEAFKMLLKKEKGAVFFMQRLNYHTLSPLIVSLINKNKFVFDCDDWNIREDPAYYLGLFPSSKMEFLTRKIAGYADTCIAASAFLKDYLSEFNDKVCYIPTGVDAEFFKPGSEQENDSKITFSWIGTMYHREMCENIKFILDCFLILADKYDNIFLSIAGEGKYFIEIDTYIASSKHKDRIKIDTWILPDKIPDYLSNIDIGLLPLIQDTKFNKAKSPTKLFEYMAMAKPVVSSNIGEAVHIISDGSNGFLAKSKKEFMNKMEDLIKNPVLRYDMGNKARETVEISYSLNVLSKQLYDMLLSIKKNCHKC